MKKSKLLIPALSVASVGAVVAPMVTSCANKSEITFQMVKDGDEQEYETAFKSLDEKEYDTRREMVQAYCDAVNSNPKILSDDLINAYANQQKNADIADNVWVTVKNASITPLVYSDSVTPLLSCDLVMRATGKSSTNAKTFEQTVNYHIVNMPYGMYAYDTSIGVTSPTLVPCLIPVIQDTTEQTESYKMAMLAFAVSNFSLSVGIKYVESGEVMTDFNLTTNKASEIKLLASDEKILSYIRPLMMKIASNYFANITVDEE